MIFLLFAAGASLHQLTIVKVVTGDSGEYSCAAQNVHGSASSSTDVSVEGEKLKCWRQKDVTDVCWRRKTSVLKVRNKVATATRRVLLKTCSSTSINIHCYSLFLHELSINNSQMIIRQQNTRYLQQILRWQFLALSRFVIYLPRPPHIKGLL